MRRLAVAITTASFPALAVPANGFHTDTGPAQWSLAKVSPSGRYLAIVGVGGGCAGPLVVTDVRQTATTVTVSVNQSQGFPEGPAEACTADYKVLHAGVRLDAPLAGRALVGQWRFPVMRLGAAVPRMVGARAGDAMRALANVNVHTRLIGPVNGTVIRQSPAAGKPFNLVTGITLVAK
jgi:hypothetical protein